MFTARKSGFCKRKSKVSPSVFFDLMMYDVSSATSKSLNQIAIEAKSEHDIGISKQGIDKKFNEQAVTFMKLLIEKQLSQELGNQIDAGWLSSFNRVSIKDGTRFDLPEAYGNLLKIGGTVDIKTTTSEEIFIATICAIEPQINTATRNIKVRARLNSGKINPGSFVKVLVSKKGKAIVVPTNAIIPDALSNQVVIVKNGKAVFKNVETGFRTEDVVEIVDGLKIGDSVVVSGVLFVRPNAPVKVKKAKKK